MLNKISKYILYYSLIKISCDSFELFLELEFLTQKLILWDNRNLFFYTLCKTTLKINLFCLCLRQPNKTHFCYLYINLFLDNEQTQSSKKVIKKKNPLTLMYPLELKLSYELLWRRQWSHQDNFRFIMQNVFRDPKNSFRIPFVYRGQATSIILKLRKSF